MPSVVVKQIRAWQVPQNLPSRPTELVPGATVRLAIEFDGHGYCFFATEIDGDYTLSEWHPSLKAAEQSAAERFGPRSRDWETMGMQ
ncbi:hypothetical protein N836_03895 [Leptolyngbya sp. Heron Island J]|uniref:hypothetical protein n=1 Tax=Leptolyngbya sp. Heron Island J TaxID=1385935 RepID=UPI0003B9AEE1|nr:hypothetical protein [Leptolyngbya sp. Heron Island J]ESA37250.1 hypothetical protein N836_03895 [Leptolyngbya sp. Heron Island J]